MQAPTEDPNKAEEEEETGPDMVDVVIVNKAKLSYFFTDRVSDATRLFEHGDLELRLTLGKNWNKYIAVYKTSLLRHFKSVEFHRSTETHYSKNVLLFSDTLEEGLNLRLTLGVALDKQTDVSDIAELQPYLSDTIKFPPQHFYNKDISMNIMPQAWFEMLSEHKTDVHQDPRDLAGSDPHLNEAATPSKKRPNSEAREKKQAKYATVKSRLLDYSQQEGSTTRSRSTMAPVSRAQSRKLSVASRGDTKRTQRV